MTGIYVVAVNDVFVVEAWKKSLLAGKESDDCVHFLADSTGTLPTHPMARSVADSGAYR